MAEQGFYDNVALIKEARRYQTSIRLLDLLLKEWNGSSRILLDGIGSRLITTPSALTDELYGVDTNPGSIERAEEFIAHWREYEFQEPFKTEFDFLKREGLMPNFKNRKFYLVKDFPAKKLQNSFDGELASELFLHLAPEEITQILGKAYANLKPEGTFIFTAYISGRSESLDERFRELGKEVGWEKENFIEEGIINIKKIAGQLKETDPERYSQVKELYWLDLEQVRTFSTESVEDICANSGFKIKDQFNFNGGMFPYAYRLAYVLEK